MSGCARPITRRAVRSVSSSVVTASRTSLSVLNSVAIVFVLHLDNYVDLDLPDRNFFRLATSEQLKRHAARSRSVLLF